MTRTLHLVAGRLPGVLKRKKKSRFHGRISSGTRRPQKGKKRKRTNQSPLPASSGQSPPILPGMGSPSRRRADRGASLGYQYNMFMRFFLTFDIKARERVCVWAVSALLLTIIQLSGRGKSLVWRDWIRSIVRRLVNIAKGRRPSLPLSPAKIPERSTWKVAKEGDQWTLILMSI